MSNPAFVRLLLTCASILLPAVVQAQDFAWSLRAGLGPSLSGNDTTMIGEGQQATIKPRLVTQVDATATLTRKFEGRAGLMSLVAPVSFARGSQDREDTSMRIAVATVGFGFHQDLGRDYALYGGAFAAWTGTKVATAPDGRQLRVPSTFGVAYDIGLRGFSCRECQGFGWDARLTWIDIDPPIGQGKNLSSPLLLTAGLVSRF